MPSKLPLQFWHIFGSKRLRYWLSVTHVCSGIQAHSRRRKKETSGKRTWCPEQVDTSNTGKLSALLIYCCWAIGCCRKSAEIRNGFHFSAFFQIHVYPNHDTRQDHKTQGFMFHCIWAVSLDVMRKVGGKGVKGVRWENNHQVHLRLPQPEESYLNSCHRQLQSHALVFWLSNPGLFFDL